MKKSISSLFISLAALSVFFFSSCEVGLGESPDLEAPEITITSITSGDITIDSDNFGSGVYCKKTVIVRGTAIDNRHVSSVSAEIKWDSETEYKPLKTASLNGSEWVFDITFEKEGNVFVKFTASDDVGNSSIKSVKNILLFVDDEAPVSNGWYIKRENGFQYNLQTLETLKSLNLDDEQNKDAAQNVKFSIFAGFNDTMGIKDGSLKIKLRDENKNTICEISKKQDASNYAPQFDVTHELLTQASAALGTGIHYIEVLYEAEDIVSIPESNKAIDVSAGWFIWWPESDLPRITNSALKNDEMVVHIKDSLSISLFDDDELGNAYFALLKTEDDEEISEDAVVDWSSYEISPENVPLLVSATDRDARSKSFVSKGERETVISLTAPATAQKMRLLAIAWDNSAGKKVVKKDIKVTVIDDANPMLIIESPESNKIPSVTMEDNNTKAKITIKGMSLDTVGCSSLEFAWVPDSVASNNEDKETKAKAALNHQPGTPGSVITYEGIKVWSVVLGSAQASGNFKQQNFQFDLDLLNDFTHGSTNEKKNDKFFVVKLTRNDGKFIYQDYKLAKDNQLPVITVLSPDHDMSIQESTSSFDLTFTAEKASGLPIQQNSYTIERIDVNPPVPLQVTQADDGSYKATISQTDMNDFAEHGTKPKYKFSATDIFENTGSAQYTIVVSDLPKLVSITTTAPALCKETDEIIFNLNFSGTVEVDSNLTGTNRPYLKLKGISNSSNSDKNKAYYKDGSGSTTLQFAYEVKSGDTTGNGYLDIDALASASPLVLNGASKLGTTYVHLTDNWTNSITEKNIKIDGIKPKVTSIVLSHDIAASEVSTYTDSDKYVWLKEGRTITATVTLDENISLAGDTTMELNIGEGANKTTLSLPLQNASGRTIKFSKKLDSTEYYGVVVCEEDLAITDCSVISDTAGNTISEASILAHKPVEKIGIDTRSPKAPKIKNSSGEIISSGKYKTSVAFIVEKTEAQDNSIRDIQYSLNGGSSWNAYSSSTPPVTASAQLTARCIDYAGNISPIVTPINLDINNSFPQYTLECTDSDGYYKAGQTLTFKISFAEKVNIPDDSNAKIYLGGSGAVAEITSKDLNKQTATFTYTVKKEDQFKLCISAGKSTEDSPSGVHLGEKITDLYGFTDQVGLTADYSREIICDGVFPYITSMTSDNKTETAEGFQVYPNGNVIKITFNEPVQKGEGNIILRQVKDWAIPPVIEGDDFNTILNAIPSTFRQGNLTGSKVLYMDGAEDAEDLRTGIAYANDSYHGTGQFIGPYKKSSYGIKNGKPDTSAKYVLDFDMGIKETDDTPHYYGSSFAHAADYDYKHTGSKTGLVEFSSDTSKTAITVNNIRNTLEAAGYHERVLDVTSASVKQTDTEGKEYTITFPKGLTGYDELPYGREWELVISKGAFIDYAEHKFGFEYKSQNSNEMKTQPEPKDAIMRNAATKIENVSQNDDWVQKGRGRYENVTDPVVLIQPENGKNSFWSDKVATPVIRIDRYSYGLGIKQSDENGNQTDAVLTDAVTPTGYVRARIDCETKGVDITYATAMSTNNRTETINTDNDYGTVSGTKTLDNSTGDHCYSYITTTSIPVIDGNSVWSTDYEEGTSFALGDSNYTKSCKHYIEAKATKSGFTDAETATGKECAFRTVIRFYQPYGTKTEKENENATDTNYSAGLAEGHRDFSIRGTTKWGGEPTISPFPLRDSRPGSPYLRRCYRERAVTNSGYDFYWVSYEILVDSSVSGYSWHNDGKYDWCKNWGYIYPGEFTICVNMRNWN